MGNSEIAEDLTHDTFVRVKYSIDRFKGKSSYYTWIISIARNVTYDYLRRKKLIQFVPILSSNTPVDVNTPVDYLYRKENVQELYQAIKKLKLVYQEIIILRYIQELSIEETASILGWTQSKVKSTTYRAVRKLKEELIKIRGVKK